ncbi:MAG: tetratricopeptide repeat protein [Cardiobacteriaceae bacterium]|nr:tetratricopeptide repeat protein [Cardiobacteriaceae bacterium]
MKKIITLGMAGVVALTHAEDVPVALLPANGAPVAAQPANTPVAGEKSAAEQTAIIAKYAGNAKAGTPAHSTGQVQSGSVAPSATSVAPPPWSGYQAAESLATNGNPDLALRQLEARLASAPDDRKAAYLKGLIMMQMGKGEDAERWFRMMQVNFADMAQPYNALAVIYDSRGDLQAARDVLEALLEKQPEQHSARVNLGNIYLKLARGEFEKALKDKPDDAMIRRKLKAIQEGGGP